LKCDYEHPAQPNEAGIQARLAGGAAAALAAASTEGHLTGASRLFQDVCRFTAQGGSDVAAHVLSILIAHGEGIPSVAHAYFRTIDVWLPILTPTECTRRLETICADQDAEMACLLLCMYLVTQPPTAGQPSLVTQSPTTGQTSSLEMQTTTYFQAKALHAAFTAAGHCALEIIQAGLLISLYEQGHGMIDAAQLSMATCIRLAIKMKLRLRTATEAQRTEFGRLWWGILILDRYMCASPSPSTTMLILHQASEPNSGGRGDPPSSWERT
jgi:hypothetical protein